MSSKAHELKNKAQNEGKESKKYPTSKSKQSKTQASSSNQKLIFHTQKIKEKIEEPHQHIEIEKPSEKTLRIEFDDIESRLRNRDIKLEDLQGLVNPKVMSHIIYSYHHYESLREQNSRIILQIYSHYDVRFSLNQEPIKEIILPLLLCSYKEVNESAALECLQGLYNEGGLSLISCIQKDSFKEKNSTQSSLHHKIETNCNFMMSKFIANPNSIFLSGLFSLLVSEIKGKITASMKTSKEKKELSRKSNDNSHFILTQIVLQLTNSLIKMEKISSPEIIVDCFELFIEYEGIRFDIGESSEKSDFEQEVKGILFKWAVFSIVYFLPSLDNNKIRTKFIYNNNKEIFNEVMQLISKKAINENKNKEASSHKDEASIFSLINFISTFIFPFSSESSTNPYISNCINEVKLLVLIYYRPVFLFLINNVNYEDYMSSESVKMVMCWIWEMALFCDELKKKHKLDSVLENMISMRLVPQDESPELQKIDFESSEETLYRLLISIEKCLPKYSLKYYQSNFMSRPGVFHLYFIDQILTLRDPSEVKNFFLELTEKWAKVEMRDFNMLGYVCKFFIHFLNRNDEDPDKKREGIKILINFFKELSPKSLVVLNLIFYESSFSEVVSQQVNISTHENKRANSNCQENMMTIPFYSSSPPPTLSFHDFESEIKSCGYSNIEKTLYIDKNFQIAEELLSWSPILHEIYDEEYYYHCKFFYHLTVSAYCPPKKCPDAQQNSKERQSLNFYFKNNGMSEKISQVIDLLESAINLNKIAEIYSIFQFLFCCSFSYKQCEANIDSTGFSKVHLKRIFEIIITNFKKFMLLPSIHNQNIKEALKEMQYQNEVYENFKKEENKTKNRQIYFLKSVNKFIEQIAATDLNDIIPKEMGCEEVIEIILKLSEYAGELPCWRSLRILSRKAGKNSFIEESLRIMKNNESLSEFHVNIKAKATRKKLELFRELIFSYIEEPESEIVCNNYANQTYEKSENSNISNFPSISYFLKFELKLTAIDIIQFCVETLHNNILSNDQKALMKSEKEEIYNKILALEIIQEVFSNHSYNRKCFELITILGQSHKKTIENLLQSLILILFRNSNIITKYERRMILHARSNCLKFIASNSWIFADQFLNSNFGLHNGINIKKTFIVMWHLSLDEEIEMRVQILNILTSLHKEHLNSEVQQELYFVSAILTLFCTLEPRPKIKALAEHAQLNIYNKILESGCDGIGFALGVCLTLGYLIFNSKINLPGFDILDCFCTFWLKNNKDMSYLIISAIEEIMRMKYRFVLEDLGESVGSDLKVYYLNAKNKKGWVNCNEKKDNLMAALIEDKSELIYRIIRIAVVDKNKHVKFLKSKREAVFDLDDFLKTPETLILEKRKDSEIAALERKSTKEIDNELLYDSMNESEEDTKIELEDMFSD